LNAAELAAVDSDSPAPASPRPRRPFAGVLVTCLGTLASRVLGLLRDISTASLLGMSGSGVLDAFVVAMRVPNFFRRLVGEGALSAGYVPVLARAAEHGPRDAWKLASVVLLWLGLAATVVVVALELVCLLAWNSSTPGGDAALLAQLAATMLPFVIFVCLAAHLTSTLHVYGNFTLAALSTSILNVSILLAAWYIAPRFASDNRGQALILAASVSAAGIFQFIALWSALRRLGFRWDYDWPAARIGFWQTANATLPMVLGLGVTQINTLLDSLVAWSLTAPNQGEKVIAWLGPEWQYPLTVGAASAIYYGERLYQFPVGMLGVAVATVIFPLLARHAARGERQRIADDLVAGLRLVLFFGLPASVGMALLAEPISRLMLERGEFTAQDAARTARMIACYGGGAWAYCGIPVIVRGYYAMDDRRTPLRLGMLIVAIDFISNIALVWPLAELGLAVGTTLTALVQFFVLVYLFARFHQPLAWNLLLGTFGRAVAGCVVMTVLVQLLLVQLPNLPGTTSQALRMGVPALTGVAVFLAFNAILGGQELKLLARPRF
jgi:putative peptidoglycan lipid II flippase